MDYLVQRLRYMADDEAPIDMTASETARQAADKIERLRAQLAARDRDAERYRWLRARRPGGKYRIAGLIYSDGDANFDAAIDAAMAKAER